MLLLLHIEQIESYCSKKSTSDKLSVWIAYDIYFLPFFCAYSICLRKRDFFFVMSSIRCHPYQGKRVTKAHILKSICNTHIYNIFILHKTVHRFPKRNVKWKVNDFKGWNSRWTWIINDSSWTASSIRKVKRDFSYFSTSSVMQITRSDLPSFFCLCIHFDLNIPQIKALQIL